jgi:hypothetical protein
LTSIFVSVSHWLRGGRINSAGNEPFARSCVLITTGRHQGINMADRAGLGFFGFILGGITAAVMLVAITLVVGHMDGSLAFDAPSQIVANQISANQ